jgi:benzoyl-CoA reductase/2-hydroxyglutaryl-CoA dehydratase subunit BcrC/BadD/HgdB
MSIEPNLEREIKRRFRRVRADVELAVYSTNTFCDAHEISRTQLYKQWKQGRGPRFYWEGDQRRITREAAAEYRAEREAETKSEI